MGLTVEELVVVTGLGALVGSAPRQAVATPMSSSAKAREGRASESVRTRGS